MSDKPSIVEALAAVMTDVQAVRQNDVNKEFGYSFRGIDAVMNAVGPAFRKHNVVCLPEVVEMGHRDVQTSKGKPSRECTVRVAYTFYGPAGDSLRCVSAGEAMDSGDKGTPKAMSVAFRVALLQALCIPTGDADPDSQSYERGTTQQEVSAGTLRGAIAVLGGQMGWDRPRIEEDFTEWSRGQFIGEIDDVETLAAYRTHLDDERKKGVREHKALVADVNNTTQAGHTRKDSPDKGRVQRSDRVPEDEFSEVAP